MNDIKKLSSMRYFFQSYPKQKEMNNSDDPYLFDILLLFFQSVGTANYHRSWGGDAKKLAQRQRSLERAIGGMPLLRGIMELNIRNNFSPTIFVSPNSVRFAKDGRLQMNYVILRDGEGVTNQIRQLVGVANESLL